MEARLVGNFCDRVLISKKFLGFSDPKILNEFMVGRTRVILKESGEVKFGVSGELCSLFQGKKLRDMILQIGQKLRETIVAFRNHAGIWSG